MTGVNEMAAFVEKRLDEDDPDPWDDAPALCEYCGHNPPLHDTAEGFLCGWCDRRLNPHGGDDD